MRDGALLSWGSYDVDNFGDLLFPFLVEHHLGDKYGQIVHVSPTGTPSIWRDARRSCTVAEALKTPDVVGLVVGGGNLVSWTASSSINYVERGEFARIVHPSFGWVPYVLRAKYGIPYAYNHVGVAKAIPPTRYGLTKTVIEPAAFMSCRDRAGKGHLRRAGVTSPIAVGPDSAIDIAHVFPRKALTDHFHDVVRGKYGIPRGAVTVVMHVKDRYLKSQWDEVVGMIDVLCASGLHPVLVPLGMCHGDDAVLHDSRLQSSAATCVLTPDLLVDMLALLATARFYVGSSLHGAIASLSYGNRAVVVADEGLSRLCKFSGFLAQVNLSDCLYASWKDAYDGLVSRGTDIFGGVTDSTTRALARRRNTWKDIDVSLRAAPRSRADLALDQSLESWVRDHYAV